MTDLKNSCIAVIGGNGLIGSTIVEQLHLCGSRVIAVDVKKPENTQAEYLHCNMSNLDTLEQLAQTLISEYKINGLVNASFARAEGWKQDPFHTTWQSWTANINSQLNSVCLLSLYTANKWSQLNHGGSIVNIGSIFGEVSPPEYLYDNIETFPALPYPAIKGGLVSFTTFLAAKFGKKKIRANCVSPGVIEGSPMQKANKFIEGMSNNMLGRIGMPHEIAAPVAFLLSEDASFITGQNLIVDGGWTKM